MTLRIQQESFIVALFHPRAKGAAGKKKID